jgi:adenosylcobinamide-GDP ribazoletransferase
VSRALRGLAAALAYYTILPIGSAAREGIPELGTLAWLPLIGALVGAIAGWGGYAVSLWLHAPWGFVVAWALAIGLTGAIHLDGFLDCCDGLLASVPPQRRLEILKDPCHGTFAIAGMALASVFWLAALAAISPARYPIVLAFSAAAARFAAIAQARLFPYARPGGPTQALASSASAPALLANVLFAEILAWFVTPWALVIAPAATLCAWLAAWWASRRLGGGLTGDVYGALVVASEVTILVALSLYSPWASE